MYLVLKMPMDHRLFFHYFLLRIRLLFGTIPSDLSELRNVSGQPSTLGQENYILSIRLGTAVILLPNRHNKEPKMRVRM